MIKQRMKAHIKVIDFHIHKSKFIQLAQLNDQTANSKAYVEVINFHT